MEFSNYLATELLNEVLRGIDYSPPAATYLSLHTSAGATKATADWAATEIDDATAINYVRATLATSLWTAPSAMGSGYATNTNADVAFPTAGSSWGLITHLGFWDDSNSGATPLLGNLLYIVTLPGSGKLVGNGDVATFLSGNLTVRHQ